MNSRISNRQLKIDTTYELFIGALSLLSIVNSVLSFLVQSHVVAGVIFVMDFILSAIFFGDFLMRLKIAPLRGHYVWREFGWADLLSSLPFPQIKILRIFSLVRVARLAGSDGASSLLRNLVSQRASSTLLTVTLLIILLMEFGGIGIAYTEGPAEGATIHSGLDAIWYVFVTITTVGYGDVYPVTVPGRLMGLLIMLAGVGLFAVLTGYIANWFLAPRKPKVDESLAPQDPRRQLAEVQAELAAHEKAFAELREKLREIEKGLG